MRYFWGGLSLLFFFAAVGLFILMVVAATNETILPMFLGDINGVVLAVAGFAVLLMSYFARRISRRYP